MVKFALLLMTTAVVVCGLLVGETMAAEYAVLACGSRGFFNYRHQADLAHSYRSLRERGIPEENIITMMYDDVANNARNPFPGKLFNRPAKDPKNAVDVYEGLKLDYRENEVTPKTFLNVLQGNKQAVKGLGTERVLETTENDDVFVYIVDHGAPGLFAFPVGGELHAADMIDALENMHSKKMYQKLVFYLEACESGSMFERLKQDINVYAVTAANARESSWATYCPPVDDLVNGQHLGTCLGDEFSVHWMEDTDMDSADGKPETLMQQYKHVKNMTKKSHVLDFGAINEISKEDIGDFMGGNSRKENLTASNALRDALLAEPLQISEEALVDSRDVALISKFYAYVRNPTEATRKELEEEMEHRKRVDLLVQEIAKHLIKDEKELEAALGTVPENPNEWNCHRTANTVFKKLCTENNSFSDYSLKYSSTLLTLCEKVDGNIDLVIDAISKECDKPSELSELYVSTSLSEN